MDSSQGLDDGIDTMGMHPLFVGSGFSRDAFSDAQPEHRG